MLDPSAFADSLLCAQDNSLPVVAKTPYLDRGAVVKLLDSGASCLQLPMTETPEQILTLHNWLKYPPEGERAVSCGYGSTGYKPTNETQPSPDETWNPSHITVWQGQNAVSGVFCTNYHF